MATSARIIAQMGHVRVDGPNARSTNGGGVSRVRGCFVASLILAAFVLTSCAGSTSSVQRNARTQQFERTAVSTVLRAGFGEIRDKALVEYTTAQLFTAGLKGISFLDPRLRFSVDEFDVIVSNTADELFRLPKPADDDLQGWVTVSTTVFERARDLSAIIGIADRETLYQFMFDGALALIDPYSRYSGSRNARAVRAARNGFIGIGIEYDMRIGGAIVSAVTEDGPAKTAGLQVEDLISAVDGKNLMGVPRETARRLIAGPPDSIAKLTVFRPGFDSSLTIPVRRSLIVPRTVDWSVADNIAYLRVHSFNVRTSVEVSQAVAAAKAQTENNVKGYVLDLRGDPGGLLDQAVDLSDLFLDGGSIVTLSGRHPGAKQFYSARPGDIADGKPMVIVVDGKSASSAEITAAALADNGRALTIGTNTLGKGSVQTLIRLPNDGEIALTWAEVVSPGGYHLHGLGVLPTICTSNYTGPLASIMEHVYRREAPWRAMPEAWRAEQRTPESVGNLRQMCPAQSRPEEDLDQALAIRVAADRALYAQAASASLAASR